MKLIKAFQAKLNATIDISGSDGCKVVCLIGKYKRIWPKSIAS